MDGRETYDAMAADYVAEVERSPYLTLYEQPALRGLLPPVRGRRVLDAGCGAGRNAVWLVEQGAEVVGLDASPEMLRRARERVPAATLSVADLSAPLELETATFDLAVASLVLHYLRDWVPTLRELRRVLRPDGALVLSTHHPERALELSPTGDYFATELVVDRWSLGRARVRRAVLAATAGRGLPGDRGQRVPGRRASRAAAATRVPGALPGRVGAPRSAPGVPGAAPGCGVNGSSAQPSPDVSRRRPAESLSACRASIR